MSGVLVIDTGVLSLLTLVEKGDSERDKGLK